MANLKAVKRKMSKWGVLGNAFLSVVLAVSLMPSYAAFGDDGQEESPKAAQEQNQQVINEPTADGVQGDGENEAAKQIAAGIEQTSQARDYYYVDTISGASWVLKVNTADGDMPQAATPDDLMSWFGAANVTFSADEACVSSRLRFSKEQNIFHKT